VEFSNQGLAGKTPNYKTRDYLEMLAWLTCVQMGQGEPATKELNDYLDKRWPHGAPEWTGQLMARLLGRIDEQTLLISAKSPDPKIDAGQRCEAWFYSGMKHLLAKETPAATECFQKSLATGKVTFVEYALAIAELKTLGQK
jgi:lipoprotein NlpI